MTGTKNNYSLSRAIYTTGSQTYKVGIYNAKNVLQGTVKGGSYTVSSKSSVISIDSIDKFDTWVKVVNLSPSSTWTQKLALTKSIFEKAISIIMDEATTQELRSYLLSKVVNYADNYVYAIHEYGANGDMAQGMVKEVIAKIEGFFKYVTFEQIKVFKSTWSNYNPRDKLAYSETIFENDIAVINSEESSSESKNYALSQVLDDATRYKENIDSVYISNTDDKNNRIIQLNSQLKSIYSYL